MSDDSERDIAGLFARPTVTERVEFTLDDGSMREVRGMLERHDFRAKVGGRYAHDGERWSFRCMTRDIADIRPDTCGVIKGYEHEVDMIESDEHGVSMILFKRVAQREQKR